MKKIVFIVYLSLLCACAPSLYVQPETNDYALLKIENDAQYGLNVGGFKNAENCSGQIALLPDPGFGKRAMTLGHYRDLKPRASAELKIAANELFSFYGHYLFSGAYSTTHCTIPGTFEPKSGEIYVAQFAIGPGACYLNLTRVGKDGTSVQVPTFRVREHRTPITGAGSSCKDTYN